MNLPSYNKKSFNSKMSVLQAVSRCNCGDSFTFSTTSYLSLDNPFLSHPTQNISCHPHWELYTPQEDQGNVYLYRLMIGVDYLYHLLASEGRYRTLCYDGWKGTCVYYSLATVFVSNIEWETTLCLNSDNNPRPHSTIFFFSYSHISIPMYVLSRLLQSCGRISLS